MPDEIDTETAGDLAAAIETASSARATAADGLIAADPLILPMIPEEPEVPGQLAHKPTHVTTEPLPSSDIPSSSTHTATSTPRPVTRSSQRRIVTFKVPTSTTVTPRPFPNPTTRARQPRARSMVLYGEAHSGENPEAQATPAAAQGLRHSLRRASLPLAHTPHGMYWRLYSILPTANSIQDTQSIAFRTRSIGMSAPATSPIQTPKRKTSTPRGSSVSRQTSSKRQKTATPTPRRRVALSDDDGDDDDEYEMETPTRKSKARSRAQMRSTPSRSKDIRSKSSQPVKEPSKKDIASNYDDWEPSLVMEIGNVLKQFNIIRYDLKELAPNVWNKECRWILENARLKRQVETKPGWKFTLDYGTNLLALLIHIAGDEASEQCGHCARPGSGSLLGPVCVVSPWPEIRTKACGNCYYAKGGSKCDHHNIANKKALVPVSGLRLSQEDKTMKGYLDQFQGMDIPSLMNEMHKQNQRSIALQAVLAEKLGVRNPAAKDNTAAGDEAVAAGPASSCGGRHVSEELGEIGDYEYNFIRGDEDNYTAGDEDDHIGSR